MKIGAAHAWPVAIRRSSVDEADRRARLQLETVIRDLRVARLNAGLTQAAVARRVAVSRPLFAAWESGRITPTAVRLARWGAVVGLDVSIRAFPGGSPLRDAGQLRILDRFQSAVGDAWAWRTEVPVSPDPRDRRAFDALLSRGRQRIAVEVIVRLVDVQGQVRPILLKQQASGVDRVVLVLADSRLNRSALRSGHPTLMPAFPTPPRKAMAALRAGELPSANCVVLV